MHWTRFGGWLVLVLAGVACSVETQGSGAGGNTGGGGALGGADAGGSAGITGSAGWASGATAGAGGSAATGGSGAAGAAGSGAMAGSGASAGAAGTGAAAGSGGFAGASGGAGGSLAGAGGVAGTGGSVGEDCTNGTDDDNDGKVDCADSDCTPDFQCVPEPPTEWGNVQYVQERATGAPALQCNGLVPTSTPHYRELDKGSQACSCECGFRNGGSCSGASVSTHTQTGCGGGARTYSGDCSPLTGGTVLSFEGSVSVADPGSCAPFASETQTAASWRTVADVCASSTASGGCKSGQVCVRRPPTGFTGPACVEQAGDVGCPGGYGKKTLYYAGFDDTRGCDVGSCSCDPPSGTSCTGTIRFYPDTACASTNGSFSIDGNCKETSNGQNYAAVTVVAGNVQGGSCNSKGTASKTGDVTERGTTTVCCH